MNEASCDEYHFEWNRFATNSSSLLQSLRDEEMFKDVALVCEGGQVSAHKVILSGCSSVLKSILERDSHPRPMIYFRGVKLADLEALMDFVYKGDAYVAQPSIHSFLALAEDLKVKGLSEQPDSDGPFPKDNNNIAKKVSMNDSGHEVESKSNIKEDGLPGIRKLAVVKDEALGEDYHDLFNKIQSEEPGEESPKENADIGDHKDNAMKPDRSMLLAHISKVVDANGKDKFMCDLCWKCVGSKENVLSHLERHHFAGKFTYNCQHCNKQYNNKGGLMSHLSIKHR